MLKGKILFYSLMKDFGFVWGMFMLMYIYIKEGIFYVCFVIFLLMRKIILLKMYMEFEYDLFKRWFLKII